MGGGQVSGSADIFTEYVKFELDGKKNLYIWQDAERMGQIIDLFLKSTDE